MIEFRPITLNGVELWRHSAHGLAHWPVTTAVEGLLDGPDWEAATGERTGTDGAWSGTPRRKARGGSLTGSTRGVDELAIEAWMDELNAATVGKDLPLTFHLASGPRTLLVRVDGKIKLRRVGGVIAEWQIPLIADDPALYLGDGVTPGWTGVTQKASETGGVSFPLDFPLLWDSAVSGGLLSFRNPGASGRLELRLDGPLTNPRVAVSNSDGTRTLAWNLTLNAGEFLTVDPARRQALLMGNASRPPTERGWPRLTPGTTDFSFHAAGASPGTLTVTAWPAL